MGFARKNDCRFASFDEQEFYAEIPQGSMNEALKLTTSDFCETTA